MNGIERVNVARHAGRILRAAHERVRGGAERAAVPTTGRPAIAGRIAAGRLVHGHRPSETDDMVNPGTRMGGIAASVKPSISRGSVRTVAPTSVVRRSTSSGE